MPALTYVVFGLMGLTGCVTTAEDPTELRITWDKGHIAFPGSASVDGRPCISEIGEPRKQIACFDRIEKSRKRSVVLYMHPCNGDTYTGMNRPGIAGGSNF